MNAIIIIATVLISGAIFIPIGIVIRKKSAESKITSAENEAKRLLEDAKKDAISIKKEAISKASIDIFPYYSPSFYDAEFKFEVITNKSVSIRFFI